MPRKLRVECAGACYHVINCGNYRHDLFAPRGAASSFQRCLFEACARFSWRLHAFVIMRNHFHLAVQTPEPNLSVGQRFELLGVDRQAHAIARADVWEARLQAVAAAAGITLNELPARKSAPEKMRLAAALKRITSVSNRWLAERLQMGAVTSVSSLLHRFQSAGATESKTFKTILSRFSL